MRKSYPSDITREEFEIIREELEGAKRKTHPRKYELYDIFCAILYMLKEGCSWRGIPHDYPNWQNVRYHYDIWSKPDDNGITKRCKHNRSRSVSGSYTYVGRDTSQTECSTVYGISERKKFTDDIR